MVEARLRLPRSMAAYLLFILFRGSFVHFITAKFVSPLLTLWLVLGILLYVFTGVEGLW